MQDVLSRLSIIVYVLIKVLHVDCISKPSCKGGVHVWRPSRRATGLSPVLVIVDFLNGLMSSVRLDVVVYLSELSHLHLCLLEHVIGKVLVLKISILCEEELLFVKVWEILFDKIQLVFDRVY